MDVKGEAMVWGDLRPEIQKFALLMENDLREEEKFYRSDDMDDIKSKFSDVTEELLSDCEEEDLVSEVLDDAVTSANLALILVQNYCNF